MGTALRKPSRVGGIGKPKNLLGEPVNKRSEKYGSCKMEDIIVQHGKFKKGSCRRKDTYKPIGDQSKENFELPSATNGSEEPKKLTNDHYSTGVMCPYYSILKSKQVKKVSLKYHLSLCQLLSQIY